MAAKMKYIGWLSAILALYLQPCLIYASNPKRFYMDMYCGRTLDMKLEGYTSWGRLDLTQRSKYRGGMDCWTTIRAPADHKLLVSFLDMDIHEFFKCDDYVQIYDGEGKNRTQLTMKLCDDDTPRMSLHSTGREMSVHFVSDNFVEDDGFELIFTAYHHGQCKPDEFKCSNGYCIDKDLKCNGHNNCGDNSDACEWTVGSIIGAVAVVIVIGLIIFAVCFFLRRRKRQRGGRVLKTNDPVTIPMTAPTHAYPAQSYPAPQQAQYPQPGYVPPPQPYVPPAQYPPQQGQYPPPSAPGYPPPAGQYPPPAGAQYPPPQGYPPPHGYPQAGGYPQQPPPGYPETASAPPPYQEKPPL